MEGGGGHPTEYAPNIVRVGDRAADEAGAGVRVRAGNDTAAGLEVVLAALAVTPPLLVVRKGVQTQVNEDTLGKSGEMGRMTGDTDSTAPPAAA